MQTHPSLVVLLGTGGTIAGTATDASDNVGYAAARMGAGELLRGIPALAGLPIEVEQVAQLDSKDMNHAVWQLLAGRCAHHLGRDDVAGIVITHGTDTLEETAWFLHRVLAPAKPLVLTAAMRPATALTSDGPQNLRDAVAVARSPGARGVVAVLSGRVHGARDVRKLHPYRLDAFSSGDAGALGVVEEGELRMFRAWPAEPALCPKALSTPVAQWPQVDILTSHAGASGALARALVAAGARGVVVVGTGNGSVHAELESALLEVQRGGIAVMLSSRCVEGRIVPSRTCTLPSAGDLTPAKARIELMLQLMLRLMDTSDARPC